MLFPNHHQEKLSSLCCQKELTSLTCSDPKHHLRQVVTVCAWYKFHVGVDKKMIDFYFQEVVYRARE